MVPFSNGRWTLYSEVIKKDEYDEILRAMAKKGTPLRFRAKKRHTWNEMLVREKSF